MIPIYLLTNQKHHWLVPGFAHLFNTFWGDKQRVTVASYGQPDDTIKGLPANFSYRRIDKTNYPANRWTNGLIKLLRTMPHEYFVLLLEDYWLNQKVDVAAVKHLYNYIADGNLKVNLLRFDLTRDRASRSQCRPYGKIGDLEVISSPPHTPYQMSYQAAIWKRDTLLGVLKPNEDPWQSEVNGSKRLKHRFDFLVLGSRQGLLNYRPVYRSKRGTLDLKSIPPKRLQIMRKKGLIHG